MRKPWKVAANVAKVVAALNVIGGFYAGHFSGHPVAPLDLILVSVGFYAFFAPIDAGLIIKAVKEGQDARS